MSEVARRKPPGSARHRLAFLAIVAATLTSAGAVAARGPEFHGMVALLHLGAALGAIVVPPAIVAQIVTGTLLTAGTLYAPGGARPLLLLPLLVGVVLTAELLGRLLRMDRPLDGEIRREVLEAGAMALLAGVVGGIVLLAGSLPGPSGPAGTALAAGAAIAVAVVLARARQQ